MGDANNAQSGHRIRGVAEQPDSNLGKMPVL